MKELLPRPVCARCSRPQTVCYCAHVEEVQSFSRLLVLQHPREQDKAIGTARIAALGLRDAHIAVGIDFADDPTVRAALSDPARPAVLLYPGPESRDLARERPPGPVTLVVIDGTWSQARALFRENPWLRELPRYAFAPERPSEYRIRREPREDYVSTVEAITAALSALEGDSARFEPLLAPFRAMVDMQLAFIARSSGGRRRERRRHGNTTPARLPTLLAADNLVCVSGEANAGRYDLEKRAPTQPHELVYWTALRLRDGERFDALVAPRLPLTGTATRHGRIDEAQLLAAPGVAELRAGWRAFLRDDDVLCHWGTYATDLFAAEGGELPARHVDVRKVAGDYLQRRPGDPDALGRELGLSWQPLGIGRAGDRLGNLAALTGWLGERARGLPIR